MKLNGRGASFCCGFKVTHCSTQKHLLISKPSVTIKVIRSLFYCVSLREKQAVRDTVVLYLAAGTMACTKVTSCSNPTMHPLLSNLLNNQSTYRTALHTHSTRGPSVALMVKIFLSESLRRCRWTSVSAAAFPTWKLVTWSTRGKVWTRAGLTSQFQPSPITRGCPGCLSGTQSQCATWKHLYPSP